MEEDQSLNHTKWECKYHVIRIPKYRKKAIFKSLRPHLGEALHQLARQKESKILEGHLQSDHVHLLISIPPKYSVSSVIGYMKGKSVTCIATHFYNHRRNFVEETFWAKGFYVSTAGLDEDLVRNYIKNQEKEDQRVDQLKLV